MYISRSSPSINVSKLGFYCWKTLINFVTEKISIIKKNSDLRNTRHCMLAGIQRFKRLLSVRIYLQLLFEFLSEKGYNSRSGNGPFRIFQFSSFFRRVIAIISNSRRFPAKPIYAFRRDLIFELLNRSKGFSQLNKGIIIIK